MTDFKVEENRSTHGGNNDQSTWDEALQYLPKRQKIADTISKFKTFTNPPIRFDYVLFCILKENFYSTNWANLGERQQQYVENYVEKCVNCLYQLNECKISIKTNAELKQEFPNIIVKETPVDVDSAEQPNKESLSLHTKNNLFPPVKKTDDLIKNYENAVNAFHYESSKFACKLITSFKGDKFTPTINCLSRVIEKVTEYQQTPTDPIKMKELMEEVQKFETFIDNNNPLWSCCRELIGHGLILLGKIIPCLAEYGQKILRPQFMRTKDALKDLVEAASEVIRANSLPTNT